MADKVISATLQVDTGSSVANVNAVNSALGATTSALGTSEQKATSTTEAFSNLKDGLGKLPGPMKAVNEGVNTIQDSLKVLAANPIVLVITLLVAALYGLYRAFASTEEGANKIEQIFSGLGAIVTVIRDRVLALAGAVIDFFKGDFKKALDETKAAVTGVGDDMVKAYNNAADATRELQEAQKDLDTTLAVSRAKLNRDLAASKELITDSNASYADRMKAIKDVSAAEGDQAAKEIADLQKVVDAKQKASDLDKQSLDKQKDLAQAQIALYNAQQQQEQDLRNIHRQTTQVEREEKSKQDEIAKTSADNQKKAIEEIQAAEKALDDDRKKRTELQKQGYIITNQEIADDAAATKKQQAEAEKKIDDDRIKNQMDILTRQKSILYQSVQAEDQATKAKITIGAALKVYYNDVLNVAANMFGSLANLVGKQTAAGKALSIAQTLISTYESATKSYDSLSGIPVIGPALGFAAAAAAVANGLASVKQIMSVQVPGSSATTGNISAPGGLIAPPAPLAPTQTSTDINQSAIAGIGDATSRRAYVLSQDVTHDQDRNERLNRAARLGG